MLEAAVSQTNIRIASGVEKSIVGKKVPFSSYQSRRFVRDKLFPDKPVSQVRVSDASEQFGYSANVDEIVPRQIGGRQVFENQRFLAERLNKALGPIQERAFRDLPDGMQIHGLVLEWYKK